MSDNVKVWECKIGGRGLGELPLGADAPLRQAVQRAYRELTGRDSDFTFSGWGAELDGVEQMVAYPEDAP